MPRKGGFRRGVRAVGEYIWTAILMDDVAISATVQGLPIVLSSDYSRTTSQQQATLIAIRGWLSLSTSNTTAREQVFMGIIKKDEDEDATGVSLDPGIIDFYVREDVLWTGGWQNPAFQTSVGERPSYHEILNVKAKRKLRGGQDISLQVVSQGGTTTERITGVLRGLLKVG